MAIKSRIKISIKFAKDILPREKIRFHYLTWFLKLLKFPVARRSGTIGTSASLLRSHVFQIRQRIHVAKEVHGGWREGGGRVNLV